MLNKNKFALSAGIAVAAISALCAGFVIIAPNLAAKLAGSIMHLVNIDPSMKITAGSFILGALQSFIYGYIIAFIFAWLHNKYTVKINE